MSQFKIGDTVWVRWNKADPFFPAKVHDPEDPLLADEVKEAKGENDILVTFYATRENWWLHSSRNAKDIRDFKSDTKLQRELITSKYPSLKEAIKEAQSEVYPDGAPEECLPLSRKKPSAASIPSPSASSSASSSAAPASAVAQKISAPAVADADGDQKMADNDFEVRITRHKRPRQQETKDSDDEEESSDEDDDEDSDESDYEGKGRKHNDDDDDEKESAKKRRRTSSTSEKSKPVKREQTKPKVEKKADFMDEEDEKPAPKPKKQPEQTKAQAEAAALPPRKSVSTPAAAAARAPVKKEAPAAAPEKKVPAPKAAAPAPAAPAKKPAPAPAPVKTTPAVAPVAAKPAPSTPNSPWLASQDELEKIRLRLDKEAQKEQQANSTRLQDMLNFMKNNLLVNAELLEKVNVMAVLDRMIERKTGGADVATLAAAVRAAWSKQASPAQEQAQIKVSTSQDSLSQSRSSQSLASELDQSQPVSPTTPASATSSDQFRAPYDATFNKTTHVDLRDKYRQKISQTLWAAAGEVEMELDPEQCAQVGDSIEQEVCSFFKGQTSNPYHTKLRSIIFNLGDKKNPDFRKKLLLGIIQPSELPGMDSKDMASKDKEKERKQLRENVVQLAEATKQQQTETSMFKCGKCKSRKCSYYQMQTRSADEPMTIFVTCHNCGNKWKSQACVHAGKPIVLVFRTGAGDVRSLYVLKQRFRQTGNEQFIVEKHQV